MRPVRATVFGIQEAVINGRILLGGDLPGEKPGKGDAVPVHVFDESAGVASPPKGMLVAVDQVRRFEFHGV
jgi:hypothetical protein